MTLSMEKDAPKVPFFPPPPKAAPAYRAPAPRAPSAPVEAPKPKVTVTRAEPPKEPVKSARPVDDRDRAAAYAFSRAGAFAGRKHTDNAFLQALARRPRTMAFVLFVIFGGNFLSGVHSLAELYTEGQAWVTQPILMHLFGGLAAGAAFIVVCGIPYDDKNDRLPAWFVLGFFAVALGAAAAKDQIVSLLLPLF